MSAAKVSGRSGSRRSEAGEICVSSLAGATRKAALVPGKMWIGGIPSNGGARSAHLGVVDGKPYGTVGIPVRGSTDPSIVSVVDSGAALDEMFAEGAVTA